MRQSARFVATELLREPVKQAVREALHEEASSTQATSGQSQASKSKPSGGQRGQRSSQSGGQSGGGGRSKLTMVGILLAIVGVTYLARQRMSSTTGSAWSEPSPGSVASDDAEGGYVSEGEMQTAETADEGADSEGAGTSPSTTTDQ